MPSTEVRVTSDTGAQKGTKPGRFDLIPADAIWELAEAYGKGEAKYPTEDDHIPNYMKGYDWSLSFAALQRHAWAFWGGEDVDPESGVKHIISVAWHALTLAHYMNRSELARFDTRPSTHLPKEG